MIGPARLTAALPEDALLRPLTLEDVPALLEAYLRNREHLQPFDPVRPDSFWTLEGQRARTETFLQRRAEGTMLPFGIFRGDRALGAATLNTIVMGPFCSASIGYWMDVAETGKGLTTAAVAQVCRIADAALGLHRIEASTRPSNLASQRVLAKNGFTLFGKAPTYLHINGEWTDSHLYQRILNDRPPSGY